MPNSHRRRVVKAASHAHPLRWSAHRPRSTSNSQPVNSELEAENNTLKRKVKALQEKLTLKTGEASVHATYLQQAFHSLALKDRHINQLREKVELATTAFAILREKTDLERMPLYAEYLEGESVWEAIMAEFTTDRSMWILEHQAPI